MARNRRPESDTEPETFDIGSMESIADDDTEDQAFHLDFTTFEASEAEAVSATEPAKPALSRGPQERDTLVRSKVAAGDVAVEVRPIGRFTVVTLRGRVNESFHGAELGRSLSGHVVLDLSHVDRVSSFGVRGWLQMLEQLGADSLTFYRCSEAVVNQITMMRNFCGPGRIHSLLVPYACPGCGEEFGAVFEAKADRELILGRSAPPVVCPACTNAAEVADDPFAYLAVDAHLIDTVSPELGKVFDHLNSHSRVDPVEKFVSAHETRVRFNTALTAKSRLGRAFAGLEGRVLLDFSVCPAIEPGANALLTALADLEPEIREVGIDGCTPNLARELLNRRLPRVFVKSLFCDAVCTENQIRRPVLIDVERRRSTLLEGKLPPLTATWADGPIVLDDPDLLFQVAHDLGPSDPVAALESPVYPPGYAEQLATTHVEASPAPRSASYQATPAPSPYATPAPSPYATPAPASYATPAPAQPMGTPGGGYATPAPAGYAPYPPGPSGYPSYPPPPPPASDQRPVIIAATAVVVAVVVVAVALFMMWRATQIAPLAAVAPPAPVAAAPASPLALPPAWVEQPFLRDREGMLLTVQSTGADPVAAADAARLEAVARMIDLLREEVKGSEAELGMGPPLAADQRVPVAKAFLEAEGAWATPRRVQADVREADGAVRVAVQYRVDEAVWTGLVERYRRVESFRGLDLALRLPPDGGRLVVVGLESWFDQGAVGDRVVAAGGRTFSDLDGFRTVANELWDDMAPGQTFVVELDHDGSPVNLSFRKPGGGGAAPAPSAPELMPMGSP